MAQSGLVNPTSHRDAPGGPILWRLRWVAKGPIASLSNLAVIVQTLHRFDA